MSSLRLRILVLKFQIQVPLRLGIHRYIICWIKYRNLVKFELQLNEE